MSAIAYWTIRQRLLRVPGVANVLIYGERLQQRHVQVDPQLLAKYGVSLTDVMETTANALDAGVSSSRRRSRSAQAGSSSRATRA